MPLEKPDAPVVGKVTHHTIELKWEHVKQALPVVTHAKRYKYLLQESDTKKKEWRNVYSGYSTFKTVESLETEKDYLFRLAVINCDNESSEYSIACPVKTIREPLTGDLLHKAIILDRKTDVAQICESADGPRICEIPDKFGNLPLMIAVNRNNLEMVEFLIEKGINVNSKNESGKTALMLAAFSGKINVVKVLVNNGAKYDVIDNLGQTVLHYAVDGGNLDSIQFLLLEGVEVDKCDTASSWSPLLRTAAVGGNKDVAEILLKYKANPNLLDKDNKSALMIAVINGNQPLVQILIEHGADLNIKNEYGKNAFEMAVAMDRRRVVKYLEEIMEGKQLK